MFRDLKTGGDNLESTQVKGEGLISLTLLITRAYSQSIIVAEKIVRKGVANYINHPTEQPGQTHLIFANYFMVKF